MSYQQPPPHGYPQQGYGAPPPTHSPQPGYGQQPYSPYPPPQQGQSPYPPQQQYGSPPPPQGQYGAPYQGSQYPPQQGQYPPPQGQYPPPQGQYPPQQGQPPPGQYPPQQGQPPPGQYPLQHGQPPPGQYPPQQGQYHPPQGQYPPPQGPPGGQYGAPAPGGYPPQHSYGQQPYGAPQQGSHPQQPAAQQYYGASPGYGQPTPPSPGYVYGQIAQGDFTQDVDALYKAMKGFGTNEKVLIGILSKRDPLQMAALRSAYERRHKKSLASHVASEIEGSFRDGMQALVNGPLHQDAFLVNRAIAGMGTEEVLLNDVLVGRSNADLNAIKQEYQRLYREPLDASVRRDLSGKTERLFSMIIAAQRAEDSAPVNPQQIDQEVMELHKATEAKVGKDALVVCSILSSKNDNQLRALATTYEQRFRTKLESVIIKEFSGHMEDTLVLMLRGGDRATRDAILLEDTMKGLGTKDFLLVNRVVRFHWDRNHMSRVKEAYRRKYGRELSSRIKGETRGDVERMLLACIE
ncbi:MAG: hypothetical protein M1833_003540 [Piccolia ochrophora]|nr:MAG: hypothetical protein M1833_003540 [Piccolia ochrophora]